MDSDSIISDFKSNISARNLFYLLNTGYEDVMEFIKLIRCALEYHNIKLVYLERELSITKTTLKRVLKILDGSVTRNTKIYVLAKIIRTIELHEKRAHIPMRPPVRVELGAA
ncbi:MAG: hypothetical protein HQK81_09515 [Desulfovibrionaceae bacterium]|nr:hypothetical protein [Desulfovibrionaceae bacterium]MBF0514278.1 hypothetical protein [Desulfovibrionaceae bacterium]